MKDKNMTKKKLAEKLLEAEAKIKAMQDEINTLKGTIVKMGVLQQTPQPVYPSYPVVNRPWFTEPWPGAHRGEPWWQVFQYRAWNE